MDIPNTAFGVVALVVLVVPGLVFALVRTSLRGFRADDKSLDLRITQAIVVSIFFDAIYLIILNPVGMGLITLQKDSISIIHPVLLGVILLSLAILAPAFAATIPNFFIKATKGDDKRRHFRLKFHNLHQGTPNAWDHAFDVDKSRLVRLRMPDGRWIGGWFGPGSYVSAYPEPRDIFISHQYRMKKNGTFGEVMPYTAGIWLMVPDDVSVEFIQLSVNKKGEK